MGPIFLLRTEAAGHIEGVSVLSSTPLPVFLYADIWSALKHFWVIFLQGQEPGSWRSLTSPS